MNAQEKVDAINKNKGVLHHCDSMIAAAVRSGRPVEQRITWLRDVSDRLNHIIEPHTVCAVGCAQCCRQAVTITQVEADWITKATGRENVPQPAIETQEQARAAVEKMHEDRRRYFGKPCPFLSDETCTIYEARPIACRAHHSLNATPAECSTAADNWNALVARFDTAPLFNAVAQVDGRLADIRDYFPEP